MAERKVLEGSLGCENTGRDLCSLQPLCSSPTPD